jgi:hypothetical protein
MRILVLLLVLPQLVVGQLNEDFWKPVSSKPGKDERTVYYSITTNAKDHLYVGGSTGLYKSIDSGDTWQKLKVDAAPVIHVVASGNKVFAVSSFGKIYSSMNDRLDWNSSQLPDAAEITDLIVLNNGDLIVSTGYIEAGSDDVGYYGGKGIFKSTDHAASWQKVDMGLPNDHYIAHLAQDSKGRVFASANEFDNGDGAILYSSDLGTTWQQFPDLLFSWGPESESTKIVQVGSLEIDPTDSIHVSLLGVTGSVATSVNLSNTFEGATNGTEWQHLKLVSYGYSWFYIEAQNAFFAKNGDRYAFRYGMSYNLSGIFYSKEGSKFEKKHINPLNLDGSSFFNYCVFAEQSSGRVYVLQQLDTAFYYTDNTLIPLPVLGTTDKVDIQVYPNPATTHLQIQTTNSANSCVVTIHTLTGAKLYQKSFEAGKLFTVDLIGIPKGVHLVSVSQGADRRQFKVVID